MEQVDPEFDPEFTYWKVHRGGVSDMKAADKLVTQLKHNFRSQGATASVPEGFPVSVKEDVAYFTVRALKGLSTRWAQGIMASLHCFFTEVAQAVTGSAPQEWPVCAKLSGKVDHDAIYTVRAFETNESCLRFARHVLEGGKCAGYSNVLNLIVGGEHKLLAGHYAILLSEGYMARKKVSDVLAEVPDACKQACCALVDVGGCAGSVLEQLAGYRAVGNSVPASTRLATPQVA